MVPTEAENCLDQESLAAYVARRLTAADERRAGVHVLDCARCREAIARLAPALDATAISPGATRASNVELPLAHGTSGSARQLSERYDVIGKLGAGGMGEVLLAKDRQLGRDVAIKCMLGVSTSAAEARFLREARIQGCLDHPAVVPVYELAKDDEGHPCFVMKRLSATTLADVLRRGTLSRQKLLRAFADVCLAVEFAHTRGIVHRDLKPTNVILGDFGEVYVLDWGIARVLAESDDPALASSTRAHSDLTEAGAVVGTLAYMAPEQLAGGIIDARADVYALGCILFELLVGQPLWVGATRTLDEPDARPSRRAADRDIPPELEVLCVEATRTAPGLRLPSARQLAQRVEDFLDGDRDLVMRKQLANDHIEAAMQALQAGDSEVTRATAMREAGRALALDPTARDAADLVGRLMLEPPRVVPAEVDARVARLEEQAARSRSMLTTLTVAAFLAMVPVIAVIGIRSTWAIGLYLAAAFVDVSVFFAISRKASPISARDIHLCAAIHFVLMLVVARLFTPFWLAPALVVASTIMLTLDPRVRWSWIASLMIAGSLVPWILEASGVLPRTMTAVDGNLVLRPDAITIRLPHVELGIAVVIAFMCLIMGFVANRVGRSTRAALRAVELQAWHLRQLVPART